MDESTLQADNTEHTISCAEMHEPGEKILSPDELKRLLCIGDEANIHRYANVKTIGIGGIGSVLSAYEPVLNREIAIKVLRPAYRNRLRYLNRFIREARATAQIEHPNIVPVHQLGVMDDLGAFFTMKKVDGENLRLVLEKVDQGDPEYSRKYTLRRRLEIFIQACNGVAFAHSKGIIHRDLKPSNIMLGDFGEVLVMDWGLVKYHADKDTAAGGQKVNLTGENNGNNLPLPDTTATIDGSISGTPAYMAPEQAGGKTDQIDEQTDLYSLGAILYSLLTCKASPFDDQMNTNQVLSHVVNNYFQPPRKRAPGMNIPKELEAICLKAMSGDKKARYDSVRELIKDIRNYLDNYPVSAYSQPPFYRFLKMCHRHPLIPSTIIVALGTFVGVMLTTRLENNARLNSLAAIADTAISQSNASYRMALATYQRLEMLEQMPLEFVDGETRDQMRRLADSLEQQKTEFNNYCDAAVELISQMEGLELQSEITTPKLAGIFKNRLELSILTGDYNETRRLIHKLRVQRRKAFYEIIENDKPLFDKVRMIVQNEGRLRLDSTPSGLPVFYRPLPVLDSDDVNNDDTLPRLGTTPFSGNLEAGSYLLLFEAPGRPLVRYPLMIGAAGVERLHVYIPESVPSGMVYVPAGPFFAGTENDKTRLRRVNLPGFFISKYEVTFREYIRFWLKQKSYAERRRFIGKYIKPGDDRNYVDLWNEQGNLLPGFSLDMPVVGITGEAAEAFCRYLGEQMRMPCRLPTTLEWEKAARGVDGRFFVWGDDYLPDAAMTRDNHDGIARFGFFAPPGSFSKDRSVYGVYDMAGNVREFARSAEFRGKFMVKGSSAQTGRFFTHCGFVGFSGGSDNDLGFRYVIPLPRREDDVDTENYPMHQAVPDEYLNP